MIYLDASVIVALFIDDAFASRADRAFRNNISNVVVTDFAAAEFASSIGRQVRAREIGLSEAQSAFEDFDIWVDRLGARMETVPADVRTATAFLRRLDLDLRAPDAIHIAIAQRLGAELATFDVRLADSARALGVAVAAI